MFLRLVASAIARTPNPHRALPILLTSALVVACGGSADRTTDSGRVYPVVEGVEFVELDAHGTVLQRSSSTDSQGRFTFPRPVSGSRVLARVEHPRRRPLVLSARFTADRASLTVTPLTTAFDQSVDNKVHPRVAAERATALYTSCDGTGRAPAAGLSAETASDVVKRQPALLHSLHAYLDALRQVGAGAEGSGTAEGLPQRRALLGRLCALSRTLADADWQTATRVWLAAQLGLADVNALAALPDPFAPALAELLQLVGSELPAAEFPQAAALLSPSLSGWQGRELEIARQIALAVLIAASDSAAGRQLIADAAIDRTRFRRGASYRLDKRGDVVEVLAGDRLRTVTSSKIAAVRLVNTGVTPKRVHLDLDRSFTEDIEDVLRDVVALPAETTDEPLHRRAWRYVVQTSTHQAPISDGLFIHRPELFLRSVGQGFCDDRASVLYWIWVALGHEARVWALEGHVVPEVRIDGRWQMFDPDLAVYYRTRSGAVASVVDLQDDPSLIVASGARIEGAGALAYSSYIAAVYASTADNVVSDGYATPFAQPAPPAAFFLPAGSALELSPAPAYQVRSIDDAYPLATARIGLWLPPGFSGTVPLPLVLADLRGDAQVALLGATASTSPSIAALINDFYRSSPGNGIPELDVQRVGPGGLWLDMIVNPLVLAQIGTARVSVRGTDLSSLVPAPLNATPPGETVTTQAQ